MSHQLPSGAEGDLDLLVSLTCRDTKNAKWHLQKRIIPPLKEYQTKSLTVLSVITILSSQIKWIFGFIQNYVCLWLKNSFESNVRISAQPFWTSTTFSNRTQKHYWPPVAVTIRNQKPLSHVVQAALVHSSWIVTATY